MRAVSREHQGPVKSIEQEMLRCLDTRLEVFAFGKTHRPEEVEKLSTANARLHELQRAYPATWQRLRRRLSHQLP